MTESKISNTKNGISNTILSHFEKLPDPPDPVILEQYGYVSHFKLIQSKFQADYYLLKYGKGMVVDLYVLASIIDNDELLRGIVQRVESLEHRKKSLLKIDRTDEEKKTLENYEKCQEHLERAFFDFTMIAHQAEILLPQKPLKLIYDNIREDPTWYLHDSLVKDCISKGGCCGRDCKCCETRHLNQERKRGIGHCTIECWCCQISRGYKVNHEEREQWCEVWCERHLKSQIYSFVTILPLLDAYFTLPGRYPFGKTPFVSFLSRCWKLKCPVNGWKKS